MNELTGVAPRQMNRTKIGPMEVDVVALLAAVLVAAVLLVAGFAKIKSELDLNVAERSTSITPFLIAGVEAFLALILLVLHTRKTIWIGAGIMFSLFLGYSAHRASIGELCGCFGKWDVKPNVTAGIDLFCVALAMAMTARLGSRSSAPFGPFLTMVASAAAIGGITSMAALKDPGDYAGDEPLAMFMSLPIMEDVRHPDADDPPTLVYLWSENCHVCMEHLPSFRDYAASHADDNVLRVVDQKIQQVMFDFDIPEWAWPYTPMTMLVENGTIASFIVPIDFDELESGGQSVPEAIRAQLSSGQDGLLRLSQIPEMQKVIKPKEGDPGYYINIYNPECPSCLEHLAIINGYQAAQQEREAFEGAEDDELVILTFSVRDLESKYGIPEFSWPGTPTTVVYKHGHARRVWVDDNQPDPENVANKLKNRAPL